MFLTVELDFLDKAGAVKDGPRGLFVGLFAAELVHLPARGRAGVDVAFAARYETLRWLPQRLVLRSNHEGLGFRV